MDTLWNARYAYAQSVLADLVRRLLVLEWEL